MAGYSIEKVFQEARNNARRAKINFNAIIEKYSKEFVDDDTVDVVENIIIADKGSIRKSFKKSFGTTRLKTTKRKEESQAGCISGSDSDSSFQTTSHGIIKEEVFDETSPDILQDLVNSFVQDPGYEPSDAETISSDSSSSSRITDDEDSFSEEEDVDSSPIIIKDESDDVQHDPYHTNGWYSLSKYNNYNPRDFIYHHSKGFPQSHPTPTKISIVTPEVVHDECYYHQEPISVRPDQPHDIYNVGSNNLQSNSQSARKRVPLHTLQLYDTEHSNKTFSMNNQRSDFASEGAANDVTIIPTNDESGDCFVVLSDKSMSIDLQPSSPTIALNQNNNSRCEPGFSLLKSASVHANEKNSATLRRKLKPKKSRRQSRFRTFSNEDLQTFFASDDPAVAEKIISPPESLRSDEACKEMSLDLPKENKTKEVSKYLSILAMINQIKSKNKPGKNPEGYPPETGSRTTQEPSGTLLQNLDLSPSSHLATLRLRESPNRKDVNQNKASFVNDLQASSRRQRIGRQFRSTIALSDLQKTRTANQDVFNGISSNDFQRLQNFQVRQSAPPLTSENLRIFNEINKSSCDLLLSPKRSSSMRSQPSVMILSPERPQSTCSVKKDVPKMTANFAIDLTMSPRRSSSTKPLLRRFCNTVDINVTEPPQTNERYSSKPQDSSVQNKYRIGIGKVGPDRAIQKTDLSDQHCRSAENSTKETNVTSTNLTLFENLFQNISRTKQQKVRPFNQGAKSLSGSEMSKSSCSLVEEILLQNKIRKSVSSPSKMSSPLNSCEVGNTRESLGKSKSTISIAANNPNSHPKTMNVPKSISDLSMQMTESSEQSSVNQTAIITNQLSSMKSVSSDSSTVNIHMPASNSDVFLPHNITRRKVCSTPSVQSCPASKQSNLRMSKRRQSKSLEIGETTVQNNLDTSPNKERRMNNQNPGNFCQNGFVIPQSNNIIKPIPKGVSQPGNIIKPVPQGSQLPLSRRQVPSKAIDTSVSGQASESIYDWQSDSSQGSGHFQRPVPKFLGISATNTVAPQPINCLFETSTPRKTRFIQPQSNILNDSMSTISSELPNFQDLQYG